MTNLEELLELGKTDLRTFAARIAMYVDCYYCPIEDCNCDCISMWQKWLESEAEG